MGTDGPGSRITPGEFRWNDCSGDCGYPSDEQYLTWRPYHGETTTNYVDPTNGAQNSDAYWRGAVAVKHGLPANYFEKSARTASDEPPATFWFAMLALGVVVAAVMFLIGPPK